MSRTERGRCAAAARGVEIRRGGVVEFAEEIGVFSVEDANEKSMFFLVSGKQGHRDKPSVFRIRKGSAKKVPQKHLVETYGYKPSKPEDGKEYWLWELEVSSNDRG